MVDSERHSAKVGKKGPNCEQRTTMWVVKDVHSFFCRLVNLDFSFFNTKVRLHSAYLNTVSWVYPSTAAIRIAW